MPGADVLLVRLRHRGPSRTWREAAVLHKVVFSGRPRSILSKHLTAQCMLERILPD